MGPHQLAHLTADAVAHHRRTHRATEGEGDGGCRIGRIGEHDAPDGPATNTCSLLTEALELVGAAQVTDQADSRLRPFRRRAFRTARPPRVAIRARKPCFIDRRFLLGWYVRFTKNSSVTSHDGPVDVGRRDADATGQATARALTWATRDRAFQRLSTACYVAVFQRPCPRNPGPETAVGPGHATRDEPEGVVHILWTHLWIE